MDRRVPEWETTECCWLFYFALPKICSLLVWSILSVPTAASQTTPFIHLTNFVQKNEKKSLQKNTSRWRERFFYVPEFVSSCDG
jgi:hypothetical protein